MQHFYNDAPVTVTEDLDFRGMDESDMMGRDGPTPDRPTDDRPSSRAQMEDLYEQ